MTPADRALCKQSIIDHEGFTGVPVVDTNGTTAVGFGFNFYRWPMTRAEADPILDGRLAQREAELLAAWPTLATCNGPTTRCLVEMAYQVGVSGLLLFKTMLHCIAVGDREGAAREALNSQLPPSRARDYAALLRETE